MERDRNGIPNSFEISSEVMLKGTNFLISCPVCTGARSSVLQPRLDLSCRCSLRPERTSTCSELKFPRELWNLESKVSAVHSRSIF